MTQASDWQSIAFGRVPRPPLPAGPFLVVGLGRAGTAAVAALIREAGPDSVTAWDQGTSRALRRLQRDLGARGVRVLLGRPPDRRTVKRAMTVIKSPGVSPQASVIQRALAAGREVVDELELGWRLSRAPLVAVTGTNGKSTVSGLVHAVLAQAGMRVGLVGNTQFGPALSAAADADWLVCEVSSYQLQYCNRLVPEVAVFTNLTPEHLGRHGTLERYGECKRRLFIRDGIAVGRTVVDVDDDFGQRLAHELDNLGSSVVRVGFSAGADYRVTAAQWSLRRARLRLATPSGDVQLETCLPGAYNARNVAAALAAGDLVGIDRCHSVPAITANGGPPGRLEHVDVGQPFAVIVDFAHTPDSLEQLLRTVRTAEPTSRLSVVLGVSARPGAAIRELGRLARAHSDRLVLTTSGYLGVAPLPALQELLRGARGAGTSELAVIRDRRRALDHALGTAEPREIVVIPGRGALQQLVMDPRGVPIPFDDREVARQILCSLVDRGIDDPVRPRPALRHPNRSGAVLSGSGPLAVQAARNTSAA